MIRLYILLVICSIVGVYCVIETIKLYRLQADMEVKRKMFQQELRGILRTRAEEKERQEIIQMLKKEGYPVREDADFQYRK